MFCTRGGTFSKNLVLQLFSYVMVIVYEVFTHLRRQNAKLGPHPAKLLFGFHHYRAKKKVVVNPIYGCLNLSGEKCKPSKKRISSIGHTCEEKNPKNHPKMPNFWKWHFRMVFWIFLFTGMSDWANSFFIGFAFFSW